jgi:hypothetical protein
MRHSRIRSLFALPAAALLLIAALPGTALAARPRKPDKPKQDEKPRIHLTVSPAVGFTPLTALLSGQLSGVDPSDPNFCHAAVTWIRIDPGQSEEEGLRIREDPVCLHPPEESHVVLSYSKSYDLYAPGSYLFKLIIEGKDHTRVQSAFVKVEVLRVQ